MGTDSAATVRIAETEVSGLRLLTMSGVLDGTTYRTVRDHVIKAAMDQPESVVVDITELSAPAESAWAVFTSARWHLVTWPETAVILVCRHEPGRQTLKRNGITRYLSVYGTFEAAAEAVAGHGKPQGRRRVRREFPADVASIDAARRYVTHWLTSWEEEGYVAAAAVVVTALVDNAVTHTGGGFGLRLESSGRAITVAVEDRSTVLPARTELADEQPGLTGLCMVAAAARVWGISPLPDGKVVWAVIGAENRL